MNFLLFINPWLLIIINKSIYAMRGIDGWIYKNFALGIGSAGFYQTSICVITVPTPESGHSGSCFLSYT